MIIDTNVLIYLSKYYLTPENIINSKSAISIVTKIETLGFNFTNNQEHVLLVDILQQLPIIPLRDDIADETIRLRRNYRIKLPDAIIYATALVEKLPLLTNNIVDFASLDNKVELINPFSL